MSMPNAEAEDLGPALQVEDALTVMVVILVLRVVLFVPLMSLDRARLDHAEKETWWEDIYAMVRAKPSARALTAPYEDAFGLNGKSAALTDLEQGRVRYVESADAEQNVLVIRHDVAAQTYRSLYIQKFSNVPSFKHGRIKWSPQERKWFTLDDQVDYSGTPETESMDKEYRFFRKAAARP
jgi:hypothetical protein